MTLAVEDETAAGLEQAQEVLRRRFGLESFRDGQAEVISRLLTGRSSLAIFPTGGGKSLCYQLPAILLDGLTLVVSPLIALMKDQIDYLVGQGVPAARLDSSLEAEEARQVYRDLGAGRTRLLYVSPERLGNERFLRLLGRQQISLLAVDEAHCISQWGHNFRPDYLKIAALAERLNIGRVLALTATATPPVAEDIAKSFHIDSDDVVHTGFYRPNLELSVTPCHDSERLQILGERLRSRPTGPTIVYVTLQRTAETVAAHLANLGLPARAYHAGLSAERRAETQDAFMAADDMIVVATIAFGMGIDKANIRAVYHYNLPKSLEGYMQEIGRAGRDGETSVCEMLACADDQVILENFTYGDTPDPEVIDALVTEILRQEEQFDVSFYDLSHRFDVRDLVVRTLFTYLELEGVVQSTGPFYSQFKFQPLRGSAEILGRFDAQRADFLRSVFRSAQKGKTWFTLDAEEVGQRLNQPRKRIVDALDYLEQQGDLVLQVLGVRHGYRFLKRPSNPAELIQTLADRFLRREQHDLACVRKVVSLAEHTGCLTSHLLEHFGETRQACGHCSRCAGTPGQPLPAPSHRPVGKSDLEAIRSIQTEGHAPLKSPRQLARFLCGISSPATTRAKLRKHPEFGRLDSVPFAEVLSSVREPAV